MIQTRKDKAWRDEAGTMIPYNRLTRLELMRERELGKILKEAEVINGKLRSFKEHVRRACDEIVVAYMIDNDIESIGKGNVTLFNFDRSIKLELSINDRIEFDDLIIKACKHKFDEWLNANIDEKQAYVKEMVNEAFSTRSGRLDTKKVMSLMKYESKIKDAEFLEAIKLLKDSIRRPDSKAYYRVWNKDDQGEYKNVELNFSSI